MLNQTNHQVSFRVKSYEVQSLGSGHFCGGSVISSRTILTAAHCFYTTYDRPDLFAVVVGSLRLSGYDADRTEISLVEEIVIHSGFDPSSFVNDIAVVYVRFGLIFSFFSVILLKFYRQRKRFRANLLLKLLLIIQVLGLFVKLLDGGQHNM